MIKRKKRRSLTKRQPQPQPVVQAPRKTNELTNRLKPAQTREAASAELAIEGLAGNTVIAWKWYRCMFGDIDLTECQNSVVAMVDRVNRGNLGDAEAMLIRQAVALNAMFTNLANTAMHAKHQATLEHSMKCALKAQSQCRATLETLAAIKNPPVVFARQANIANGPQQVNNAADRGLEQVTRAGQLQNAPKKLLEAPGEGWTIERRKKQARAIKTWRPWEYSTGPRTPEGKARSSRNADRGGHRRQWRAFSKFLNEQTGNQQEMFAVLQKSAHSSG
jgi:hypothetical protein